MGVTFSNDFGQSAFCRVHKGVKILSDFPLKAGCDSAFWSIGEIFPFQGLCDVWPISSKYITMSLDVATCSTLLHSSGAARLGEYRRYCGQSFISGVSTPFFSLHVVLSPLSLSFI